MEYTDYSKPVTKQAALAAKLILFCAMCAFVVIAGAVAIKTIRADDYKLINMVVTAYCPCELCCGDWADGLTASGVPAKGKIIAAPIEYAFGIRMCIPGYGEAVVQDRGGAIKGNKIDVLFENHQEALEWGVQELEVKVYVSD